MSTKVERNYRTSKLGKIGVYILLLKEEDAKEHIDYQAIVLIPRASSYV